MIIASFGTTNDHDFISWSTSIVKEELFLGLLQSSHIMKFYNIWNIGMEYIYIYIYIYGMRLPLWNAIAPKFKIQDFSFKIGSTCRGPNFVDAKRF
jgi:hypothetical protein